MKIDIEFIQMSRKFDSFGERLRLVRNHAKLTQTEVARRVRECGASAGNNYISSMETRDQTPSVEVVVALARVLGTTTDYLLGVTDAEVFADGDEGPVYIYEETDAVARVVDMLKSAQDRRRVLVYAIEVLHRHTETRKIEQMDYIKELLQASRVELGESFAEEISRLLWPADSATLGDLGSQ